MKKRFFILIVGLVSLLVNVVIELWVFFEVEVFSCV